jgi:hypothetical protein
MESIENPVKTPIDIKAQPSAYLNHVNSAELLKQLEKKNQELEQTNKRLIEAQRQQQKWVDDYTHEVGNLIRPEIVYNIDQKIKEPFQEEFLLLYDVYHAEVSIRHRTEALRIKHVMQNPETFRVLIRRDNRPDHLKTATDIKTILNDSLRHQLRDFLYYPKLSARREPFLQKLSLQTLQQSFIRQVGFEQKTPLSWVQENLFSIQVIQFSLGWEKIKLKKEGATEHLLYEYFLELFFNVFKYSDYQRLKLRFDEQNIGGKTYLLSTWENTYQNNQSISTRHGLSGIRDELQILNDSQENATTLQIIDNPAKQIFTVTLALKKDLLIYEPKKRQHPRPKKKEASCEFYG